MARRSLLLIAFGFPWGFLGFLGFLGFWAAVPAGAIMVRPLDLHTMTGQAGKIFIGRCLDVTSDLDENGIPATFLRFRVREALKGVSPGEVVLIKQIGAAPRRLPTIEGERAILPFTHNSVSAVAVDPGEESLLFLYPESDLGFTSPVGLGQGKFMIQPGADGTEEAIPALSTTEHPPRHLDDLVREIRRILRGQ